MLRNYIKIAWRNLTRQKLYSLINISGLAVGLAVCMTIMLFVAHETSYDRFHKNAARIFLPAAQVSMGGNVMNMTYLSYAAGPMIKQSQPTVESYMRTLGYFKPVIVNALASPQHKFTEDKLLFADADFFNFFSFKLLSGTAADVLKKPYSVVLSQDMAHKYFGNTNPIGKTINIKTEANYTYQVTGVAENAPSNSSIKYNFVVSGNTMPAMKEAKRYLGGAQIAGGSYSVYLLLKQAADTAKLRAGLDAYVTKNKEFDHEFFKLNPITARHFTQDEDGSSVKYLKIFPLVAALILLLALVNYMSLSTARATLRAKEVGVRKVSGASRKTIAVQFYVESALFAILSFSLGYVLFYAFKPWFLNILQLKIDSSFLYSPPVLLLMGALLLFTIVAAGSYPSLVLSAFKPVVTLKGKMSKQTGGVLVRKIFTTLQFTISVALIVCGIIIDRQLDYFRHADTGINRDNVVMIPISESFGKNYPVFKHDIQSMAGISSVATAHYAMFKGYDMYFINGATKNESIALSSFTVDDQFVSTLGLKWDIKPLPHSGSGVKNMFINHEAISALHLPANPVGSFVTSGDTRYQVGGVLKNFNFSSMEYAIQPLGIFIAADTAAYWTKVGCNLFAKIKPHTNLPTLLERIAAAYKKYDSDTPFSYSFVDEAFNEQYKAEDRLASIFSTFTLITVILAALGLFGLAAFTIAQRDKEIGIRKILGASLASITTILSKDFLKPVVLAILIASPVAWWAMHNWLQNFAFRISIPWWVFLIAGFAALFTAMLTVSYHALKSAIANPVKSLRSE